MDTTIAEKSYAVSENTPVFASTEVEAGTSEDFKYRHVCVVPGSINVSGASDKQVSVEANQNRVIVTIKLPQQTSAETDSTDGDNSQCIKVSFLPFTINQLCSFQELYGTCSIHDYWSSSSSDNSREQIPASFQGSLPACSSDYVDIAPAVDDRLFNDNLIASMIHDLSECGKVLEVIHREFIDYNPGNPPAWFRQRYFDKHTMNRCARYMLRKISSFCGWYPYQKQSEKNFPVFTKSSISDSHLRLHPKLIDYILNNSDAFEIMANPLKIKSLLLQQCLNNAFRFVKPNDGTLKKFKKQLDSERDMPVTDFYEALSLKEIEPGKKINDAAFLARFSSDYWPDANKNKDKKTYQDECRSDCYAAVMYFIKKFVSLIDETAWDGQEQTKHKYSPELLKECANFVLALRLIEKHIVLPGLDKLTTLQQQKKLESVDDFSVISESDRGAIKDLMKIIDRLEYEGCDLVKKRDNQISLFPRKNTEGQTFETRILMLDEDKENGYILGSSTFKRIREIYKKISEGSPS